MSEKKIQICVIALEPTPYNIDLFNAFSKTHGITLKVIHTTQKIWSSSHDFQEFPQIYYSSKIYSGKGFLGKLKSALNAATAVSHPDQAVIISGYASFQTAIAIFTCLIFNRPFSIWTDKFNVGEPRHGGFFNKIIRIILRSLVFKYAFGILVCGKTGIKSAIQAGCSEDKVYDFPFVVDVIRLQQCQNMTLPIINEIHRRADNRTIVFFSGRFIARKGLHTLLKAVSHADPQRDSFFLIVEGEGELRNEYEQLADTLGITINCMFVGFRQMKEHSSLIAISHIVVVPSLDDPWGIVVHEGMLLSKPVIASNMVGSAIDRIKHGENGYIFKYNNHEQLASYLLLLSENVQLRNNIGNKAKQTADNKSPNKNVVTFLTLVKSKLNTINK